MVHLYPWYLPTRALADVGEELPELDDELDEALDDSEFSKWELSHLMQLLALRSPVEKG